MPVQTFRINVPQEDLDDLMERLRRTRWPDQIPGTTWEYGTDIAYLKALVAYWMSSYDWRKQETTLNSLHNFKTRVDGIDLHFIHERGKGSNPLPLVIIHGWPSSFYEMHKIIGPLSDPFRYGGNPADAFDVVVPSLPGYGFSGPTHQRGINLVMIADLLDKLMTEELSYRRYGAQGGDWGAGISTRLGSAHPESVVGIHLNVTWFPARPEGELTEEERQLAVYLESFHAEEGGYWQTQSTKPQTLAYGLNDSPAGLAAWIIQIWRNWSDCSGDIESRFTKDELLTNIMIFWATQTVNSSMRLYHENFHAPWRPSVEDPVKVPTGVSNFPKEPGRDFRRSVEKAYNVLHWTDMPKGGHFPAMEEPELLVEDIRSFFRKLR
ncbi:MAG: epoxide hydrolase family protein [Armatimonadota bacterium]